MQLGNTVRVGSQQAEQLLLNEPAGSDHFYKKARDGKTTCVQRLLSNHSRLLHHLIRGSRSLVPGLLVERRSSLLLLLLLL